MSWGRGLQRSQTETAWPGAWTGSLTPQTVKWEPPVPGGPPGLCSIGCAVPRSPPTSEQAAHLCGLLSARATLSNSRDTRGWTLVASRSNGEGHEERHGEGQEGEMTKVRTFRGEGDICSVLGPRRC